MFITSGSVIFKVKCSSTSTLIFLILLSYGKPYITIMYRVNHWVLLSMILPILCIMYINISLVCSFCLSCLVAYIHLASSYLCTQLYFSSHITNFLYKKQNKTNIKPQLCPCPHKKNSDSSQISWIKTVHCLVTRLSSIPVFAVATMEVVTKTELESLEKFMFIHLIVFLLWCSYWKRFGIVQCF